ncbi:hypothetical protein BDW75DRAFT_235656 [Aspergillus navahoensis]
MDLGAQSWRSRGEPQNSDGLAPNAHLTSPNWRTRNSEPSTHGADSAPIRSPTKEAEIGYLGKAIYVGDLPYSAKKQELAPFLKDAGYKFGRNPSYCFVELDSKDEADQAMTDLNGRGFLDRPLKVKPSGYVFDRWNRKDAAQRLRCYPARECRLVAYMNKKLAALFDKSGVRAISKTIRPYYQGRSAPTAPHYAYVDFASPSQDEAAIDALGGTTGP